MNSFAFEALTFERVWSASSISMSFSGVSRSTCQPVVVFLGVKRGCLVKC